MRLVSVMNRSQSVPGHAAYRPDIDGMRAIAVLAVVANHALPTLATSGFVGVDIFFVLSGFLLTGIIHDEVVRGAFSYSNFYWRRCRRVNFHAGGHAHPDVDAWGAAAHRVGVCLAGLAHRSRWHLCVQHRALARSGLLRHRRQRQTAAASVVTGHRRAVLSAVAHAGGGVDQTAEVPCHGAGADLVVLARVVLVGRCRTSLRGILPAPRAILGTVLWRTARLRDGTWHFGARYCRAGHCGSRRIRTRHMA